MSGDAHHIVSPPPNGSGATALCMTRALAHAGASASDISYINAHATSTPMGAPSCTMLCKAARDATVPVLRCTLIKEVCFMVPRT